MKQTPIPEKIDKGFVGCLITPNLINSINSLIDVLTEQQKEIDELRKELYSLGDANETLAWDIEKRLQKLEPYTAMRSTGEYCVCPKPMQCNCLLNGNKCGECHSCHKLLKPQVDVMEKLKTYLTNNIGLNNNLEFIAANIIAIVKGE